jgi:riboflavin biosynthesis protein RibD
MGNASREIDEQFLRRAIRLAMNGRGRVEPNPMVGCVIVKNGRVIGEGYHAQFGGPHAEPAALANCTEPPDGATAYVTLEPCCHTNKKTPPCTPKLIDAKVARVVIGCLDPNPDVNGKGVAMLRAAGIRVDRPVLEGAAKQLIAMFQASQLGRCYVTAKWAETADRKVAGPRGARRQISGSLATRAVHMLRGRSNAIMVGVNTVLNDDPLLTARDVSVESHLDHTIVLDTHLRTPPTARLFHNASDGDVLIYCGVEASAERERRLATGPRAIIHRTRIREGSPEGSGADAHPRGARAHVGQVAVRRKCDRPLMGDPLASDDERRDRPACRGRAGILRRDGHR